MDTQLESWIALATDKDLIAGFDRVLTTGIPAN
jgi:hypothetical protein